MRPTDGTSGSFRRQRSSQEQSVESEAVESFTPVLDGGGDQRPTLPPGYERCGAASRAFASIPARRATGEAALAPPLREVVDVVALLVSTMQ